MVESVCLQALLFPGDLFKHGSSWFKNSYEIVWKAERNVKASVEMAWRVPELRLLSVRETSMVALIAGWMLSKISPAAHPIHYSMLGVKPETRFKTMADTIVQRFKRRHVNDENKQWNKSSMVDGSTINHDASYSLFSHSNITNRTQLGHTQWVNVGIKSSIARNYSTFNIPTKQWSTSRSKHVKKSSFVDPHTSWCTSK